MDGSQLVPPEAGGVPPHLLVHKIIHIHHAVFHLRWKQKSVCVKHWLWSSLKGNMLLLHHLKRSPRYRKTSSAAIKWLPRSSVQPTTHQRASPAWQVPWERLQCCTCTTVCYVWTLRNHVRISPADGWSFWSVFDLGSECLLVPVTVVSPGLSPGQGGHCLPFLIGGCEDRHTWLWDAKTKRWEDLRCLALSHWQRSSSE